MGVCSLKHQKEHKPNNTLKQSTIPSKSEQKDHYILDESAGNNNFEINEQQLKSKSQSITISIIDDKVNIFIKNINQTLLTIFVDLNSTIYHIKNQIHNATGISVSQQLLISSGITLNDKKTLYDYAIENNSTIHLVINKYLNHINNFNNYKVSIKMLDGTTCSIDVEHNDTVYEIKEKIWQQLGIMIEYQQLEYHGELLKNGDTLSMHNINENSVIQQASWVGPDYPAMTNNWLHKYEHRHMDKVKAIKIKKKRFIALLSSCVRWIDIINNDLESIYCMIYEFSKCIGGERTFVQEYNDLHCAVDDGNGIDEIDKLLKTGKYYVDQYANTEYFTPLWLAVRSSNVALTELFVLNGARRHIRVMVDALKMGQKNHKIELLEILCPYYDEDPLKKNIISETRI